MARKNILKVPESINQKVASFDSDTFQVGCVVTTTAADVADGRFAHLGVTLQDGEVHCSDGVIPPSHRGRYSKYNTDGRVIRRADLPKIHKSYGWTSPNFGDWSKGSHWVDQDRLVYPREVWGPRFLAIDGEVLAKDVSMDTLLRFSVDEVLDRRDQDLDRELLFALNLLLENAGAIDVVPSNASRADYLQTLYVDWEILPPGRRDEIPTILSRTRPLSPKARQRLDERSDFLSTLKPVRYVTGVSGFRRYFGAAFGGGCVVFENVEYGNAAYVMFEDWNILSQMSRTALLSDVGFEGRFVRIQHTRNWQKKLADVVARKRTAPPE